MNNIDEMMGAFGPGGPEPIVVELDAYVVSPSHRVWKASAGKTHRFYKAVRDSHTVFPDVRGLGELPGHPSEWNDTELLAAISSDRWARELASRARGNKEQGSEAISKQDRGVLTFSKRLWREASKGDLVVVPAEGWRENVLVGEFLTDAGDVRFVAASDGEHTGTYVGRPVKWLVAIPKTDLDEVLIGALHTRAAVFTLGNEQKEAVYRVAYNNFFYNGFFVSEFRTTKDKFTAEDHAVVSTWLNAFDALRDARDRLGNYKEDKSFEALGLEKIPDEYAAEVKIDIQSPGEIFVRSAAPFALSLMTMFALSGCDAQQVADNRVTVKLKHVGDPQDGIQQLVEDDVNSLRVALGQTRIETQGNLAERAKGDAHLTTKATLKSGAEKSN